MNASIPIVLASASPRRQELLQRLGVPLLVVVSGVDEAVDEGMPPAEMVVQLAIRKARAVASRLSAGIVIGADTTVAIDGRVLNKPSDATDAGRMLELLRGRTHEVWTGVVLIDARSGREESGAVRSLVRMRSYSTTEMDDYVATGEPMDKAGAYAIQGGAGGFVERIDGCYTNVVGLPLCESADLLQRFGVLIKLDIPLCTLSDGSPCPRLSKHKTQDSTS